MRYILAILLPPVAMFLCGKIFQAIACLILMITMIGWPVASVWALLVVHSDLEDERARRVIRAIEKAEGRHDHYAHP